MKKIESWLAAIKYSMPLQLFLLHLKRNQILLLFWLLLFSIIYRGFGFTLGIPFLFLDPEYLDKVNFTSFFLIGISLAGFSTSFHITTYIKDGSRFNFLGWLERPFMRFSLNNSLIPLTFVILYVTEIIAFQKELGKTPTEITYLLTGFFSGYIGMITLLLLYFRWTNKDIFKFVVCKLDEKLKSRVPVTRARALNKFDIARRRQINVSHYVDLSLKPKAVPDYKGFYDKSTVLQVFDQNHFNLVSVELVIFVLLLVLGIFSDKPIFQLPAAASALLLLTILIMFTGAFSYWFKGWSVSIFLIALLVFNLLVKYEVIHKNYQAFGLNYSADPRIYNLDSLESNNTMERRDADIDSTILILEKWRAGFPADKPPKLVIACASGGGQRSLVWTLNAMQYADSITGGILMKHTRLMTGASGGLIGMAYYRELYLRDRILGELDSNNPKYLRSVARDNLNPIIFSLLVNDIFFSFQKFQYQGHIYKKDRGYAFEQQLNRNSYGFMDKPLISYRKWEQDAQIPILIMSPTIINDGRKLYISASDISYLNKPFGLGRHRKLKGIEFRDFFQEQSADSLRFLSALRMSATFPYITPNVNLPSAPKMEIMDAGLTDNFGISDAVQFLHVFRRWIEDNTSGVIILTIRDSQKNAPVEPTEQVSLFKRFFSPIQGFYQNFENIQDISNDNRLESASSWFRGDIDQIMIEYNSANNEEIKERASLNWRLTEREKESIVSNISSERNQAEIQRLLVLLGL